MIPKMEDLLSMVKTESKEDEDLIRKSYNFAEKAHAGQKRKSGEPYLIHSAYVAKILAELGLPPVVVATGLVHDVLEETKYTKKDLAESLGEEIANLAEKIVKLGDIRYQGNEKNIENLRKFFIYKTGDLRALVVRLADRLHNVETLEYVDKTKQKRIALETLEVYAHLANRLSLGQLKSRLEDASFKYAYPEEYQKIKKSLENKKDVSQEYLLETKVKLEQIIRESGIKNFTIDSRQKHLYSLWNKLNKYDLTINNIFDIIAIRVIVETIEDCYKVLGLIHGQWRPMMNRIRDYIASPKSNGYQSIHTIIYTDSGGIIEIQIRTLEMHNRAENGIAAHFAYKEKGGAEKSLSKNIEWSHQLHELNLSKNYRENFSHKIELDFFRDRVFVFTPKGDIIDLPLGSSVIDFAYAIHTRIGDHALSGVVNGKNSSLNTILKTNDVVEIKTNKNGKPSPKWLEYAKTNLAKKHINNYLKDNSLLEKYTSFGI